MQQVHFACALSGCDRGLEPQPLASTEEGFRAVKSFSGHLTNGICQSAQVTSTSLSFKFSLGAAVGRTETGWDFAKLKAVSDTAEVLVAKTSVERHGSPPPERFFYLPRKEIRH